MAESMKSDGGSAVNLREVVLDILIEHETKGTYSNILIRKAQDQLADLPLSHRSFLKRLAEGTIERQIELDSVIDRHRKNAKARIKTTVRCLLRMSIYQIYYMDSVPDHAACNEAVRICRKRHLENQAGFVNALLRSVCREKEENLSEGRDPAAPRPRQLRTRPSDATIVVARPKNVSSESDKITSARPKNVSSESDKITSARPKNVSSESDKITSARPKNASSESDKITSARPAAASQASPSPAGAFPRAAAEAGSSHQGGGSVSSKDQRLAAPTEMSGRDDIPTGASSISSAFGTRRPQVQIWDDTPSGAFSISSLTRQYSIPGEILDLWRDQLGAERLEPLCRAMLEIRPVCIRLNSRLSDAQKEALMEELRAAGVEVLPGRWEPDCRNLRHSTALTHLPGFAEGRWTVQDESSQLIAWAAGLKGRVRPDPLLCRGMSEGKSPSNSNAAVQEGRPAAVPRNAVILDLCAAPGGKSLLAAMERPEGEIHAFDVSRRKTDQIRANVRRMRLTNVTVEENDAENLREDLRECADLVICDVPCSGLGVMTRKRDIKYNVTPQKIRSLTVLQKRIALNAAQMVKPGGVLLYSTCTINRLENEKISEEIARKTPLQPEDLTPYLPEDFPGIEDNHVQLFPDLHGTDGFFMARFRKPIG